MRDAREAGLTNSERARMRRLLWAEERRAWRRFVVGALAAVIATAALAVALNMARPSWASDATAAEGMFHGRHP